MMSDLRELYQEIILDHNRRPRNFGVPDQSNRTAKGHNPLCGDIVTVYLLLEGNVVKDIQFEGKGCAISIASASIMTELIIGKTEAEALELFQSFHDFVTGDDVAELADELEELKALSGVRDYPMRVKCATLAWHSMAAALDGDGENVATE
ncbi:MAG TPA: SUF system NifU family Fe-S cluster assembly protein [Alphaproteobacteria bacterium]|nr:SUF system NifU family Fe-S cluster assembly protein [Alphaproteobacteria bacterium]HIB18743.1 SUF system NifU family Fe-S cluster assembly protein [Alphaproteobacteria bacterium]HIB57380.1 SUF system NifU family Fe-S cluster assembly protein [Alphaproteobacteria bacterium]HIC70818.1 SUF system NifU family Fe-S cluster assembly protein [Alphaproteobacteria bacterium]HIM72616.1 SUF system NifU family Fe-S cluster assembly protein [Alphaproteobacteria bacterium]